MQDLTPDPFRGQRDPTSDRLTTVRKVLTRVCKENPCVEFQLITSKLSSKAQTTIPQPVRAALRLKEGDEIAYAIEDGRVVLSRVVGEPAEDPFGTFNEWNTDADRRAYAKL
jgi:antitoxin PrlF